MYHMTDDGFGSRFVLSLPSVSRVKKGQGLAESSHPVAVA